MRKFSLFMDLMKEYFNFKDLRKTFFLLKPFIIKHKKAYLIMLFLLLVDILLTIAFATFYGEIANAAVRADVDKIISYIPVALILIISNILYGLSDIYFETVTSSGVKRDMKNHMFSHILRLPVSRVSKIKTGELITYFTNDIHNLDGVIGYSLINLIRIPVVFTIVLFYLANINFNLTFIGLMVTPFAILAGITFGFIIRKNSRKLNSLFEKVNMRITETFQGIGVIRSFTLDKSTYHSFSKENEDLYQLELSNAKIRGGFNAGSGFIRSGTYYLCLLMGAYYVSTGTMSVGSLLTFLSLSGYLISPLTGAAGQWANFQRSITAIDRLLLILDEPVHSPDLPSKIQSTKLENQIEFRNVYFGYNEVNSIFTNMNLTIPAGKTVAFIGPSGAGKSTLFNLLQGFYQPQKGDILFDGVSIKEMTVSKLRSSIASVPQETFLFAGTIRENLMLARPGITEQEMIRAAKDASIHDFILSLQGGYDTEIGERGMKLSGGQKQRMAIARAILKDAPILLLDEATSALDTETEYYVKEALNSLKKNRTTLVIAHRLSTIESADLILVMDQGKIVQQGTHEELLNQPGLYQNLSRTKFKPKVELSLA
jgi:ATP-binding cassette, subfamily B, bacterial